MRKKGRAYDKLNERLFAFVPFWGLMVDRFHVAQLLSTAVFSEEA